MAQYNYKAMDKNGKAKKGSIEAINPEKAKEKLKSEGLIVQEIKEQAALLILQIMNGVSCDDAQVALELNYTVMGKQEVKELNCYNY